MKIPFLLIILYACMTISCSDKEDSDDASSAIFQKYLLEALQKKLSIQDIKSKSRSCEIVFSDSSKMDFYVGKDIFYTKIGKGKYWYINGINTNIKAVFNLVSYDFELQSIDVDIKGHWTINGESTNIHANIPLSTPEVPRIKNIVETTHFFYFYFADKTILRFVKHRDSNYLHREKRPLPVNPTSLKILCIGNSFTEDATLSLPKIIQFTDLDNISIGHLFSGGASLKHHYDNYRTNSSAGIYRITDHQMKWKTISENYSLKQALQYADWDIITFQQVSYEAGRFQTYEPHLSNLIDIAKKECKNSKPIFVWQMPWAYGTGCKEEGFGRYGYNQLKMYNDIINATKIMMNQSDIDIVVPIGTAIQNLRNTNLDNPPLDITRDFRHLDQGVGRYTASCTLFQVLIAPIYNINLFDTPSFGLAGDIPLTDKNFTICQQAAVNACDNPFMVVGATIDY